MYRLRRPREGPPDPFGKLPGTPKASFCLRYRLPAVLDGVVTGERAFSAFSENIASGYILTERPFYGNSTNGLP